MSQRYNILFCTPIMDARPEWGFISSVTAAIEHLNSKGHIASLDTVTTESYIPRARCTLQAQMLAQPGWDYLFWIDSDIGFNADSPDRLISHNVDVVVGAYPLKGLPIKYSTNVSRDWEPHITSAGDSLIPMDHASTGFMCIKRRALEMVNAAHPELKVFLPKNLLNTIPPPGGLPEDFETAMADSYYATWDGMIIAHPDHEGEQMWLSEDWGWCQRYRDLGGKIWLDPEIALNHIGKFTYQGNPEVIRTAAQKHRKEKTNG